MSRWRIFLAQATDGSDVDLIAAAVLHDSIEDAAIPYDRILAEFGRDIADLVAEVTDDTSLPEAERKRLQVEETPHKSPRARLLKIADKTSNLRALLDAPSSDWPPDRKRAYLDWAQAVVAGARGLNGRLDREFDEAADALAAAL